MKLGTRHGVVHVFAVQVYWVEILHKVLDYEFTKGGFVFEYPCHIVIEMEDCNYPESYRSLKDFKDDMGRHYLKLTYIGFL